MIVINQSKRLAQEFFQLQARMQRDAKTNLLGLSKGEMAMLGYFANEQRETTPTELSRRFELSTARVANTLNSLEKKGYVERIHDMVDRRRVTVHATSEGMEYFLARQAEAVERFREMTEYLGAEDTEEFIRIVHRINQFFKD